MFTMVNSSVAMPPKVTSICLDISIHNLDSPNYS